MAAIKNVEKNNVADIGAVMLGYEKACKTAFEYSQLLKKLGFGHPWIEAEYESEFPPEYGNGLVDIIKRSSDGSKEPVQKYKARIRLEVR